MDLNSEQSDDTKPRLSQVGIAPDLDTFSWPSKSLPYEALSVSVPPQETSPACSYLTHQGNPQTQRDMQQHGSYFELLTTMSQDNSVDSPSTMSLPSPSLMSSPMQSPTFGHGQYQNISDPNMSKHMCAICGDRASGKHYGVYSCEGCKGFFKRTVRKELQYACRDERNCIIDKRQRNRCQYCRYQKCLNSGMKKEAVQEERQRAKERGETEVESTTLTYNDMPIERILEAELAVDPKTETYVDTANDPMKSIVDAADKQLFMLVEWSKNIPHFLDLPLDDQVSLLRAGWNELLIAGFSHRSIVATDGILLATGLHIHRNSAHAAGLGIIFDRVLSELVSKMRDMKMDRTELGCLRAIVLFNPDAKGVRSIEVIENLREKVYASLEEYCRLKYPTETSRFAKLLLRLPALRSIGLKCMEHLFFCKLTGKTQIDSFLTEMLETASNSTS